MLLFIFCLNTWSISANNLELVDEIQCSIKVAYIEYKIVVIIIVCIMSLSHRPFMSISWMQKCPGDRWEYEKS